MYSFSYLGPACCSMSSFNCCFLTCIQISQQAGQVVWYAHLFQNFPQFVVIHTVKVFGIVKKAEVDVFLELSCFLNDPTDVGNLISVPLNTGWTSGSSQFMYCWSLAWRILSITLLVCEMSAIVCCSLNILWHCLFWDWDENWPFPVLRPLYLTHICPQMSVSQSPSLSTLPLCLK